MANIILASMRQKILAIIIWDLVIIFKQQKLKKDYQHLLKLFYLTLTIMMI